MEINRKAPIVARHEIRIEAPLATVWELHTRIDAWPEWNPDIQRAALAGPIAVGTVFRWETAGMSIASTIGEVVPLHRLAWSGEVGGILGIHVWIFAPATGGTGGVRVQTEESWEGASLPPQTADLQRALDDSLLRWLSHLKARAERA